MKNKKCKICCLALSILSVFGLSKAEAIDSNASNEATIHIYQFYYQPFGFRCSKTKEYLNEVIKESFPQAKYHLVDINQIDTSTLIPEYKTMDKGAAILNAKTGKYVVSDVRRLISEGNSKGYTKQRIKDEIHSVLK